MNFIQKVLTQVCALSTIRNSISSLSSQSWSTQEWEPCATFNWSSIGPSPQLNWVKCYERYECARLEVPMDWYDASSTTLETEKVAVAVIRYPTNRSRSDPDYGGSIILNPGGPGGSGVGYLRWASYEMSWKLQGAKHFDIVSFDPRGVENSTPNPVCFENNLDRQAYYMKQDAAGSVDDSEYALRYHLAAAKAFGRSCNSTIMRYMTTKLVVRDVLAIADALEPEVHEPLVNYWGLSYGTYIGNVLASLFPGRVGRMVLDGVVDAEDYRSSAWYRGLSDAQRAVDHFYDLCHHVGPAKCPLYEPSPAAIKEKVEFLIEQLKTHPIPLTSSKPYADVLTSSALRQYLFSNSYLPSGKFARAAQALHGLFQSPPNTTLIAEAAVSRLKGAETTNPSIFIHAANKSWNNPYPINPITAAVNEDAERAIACTDGAPINQWTEREYKQYLGKIRERCPLVADWWAGTSTSCTGWPSEMRAPEHVRFDGSFGSRRSDYDAKRGARPILFIGNEADPVTPLRAARAESSKHEGSVVLATNVYGHATVPLTESKCVWDVLRRYFNSGELPEQGTVCEEDDWEWKV